MQQKQFPLFDHIVGASDQRRRHFEAERFRAVLQVLDSPSPSSGRCITYGVPARRDVGAGSQVGELAVGNDRTRRRAGGRAAWRLKQNRQRRIGSGASDQIGGHVDMNRALRLDQPE